MARYLDVHPDNPNPRAIITAANIIRSGGVIAYPTDSGFAFGCALGNSAGLDDIRQIRQLNYKHHFTLTVSKFELLGQYVIMDNWVFRAVRAAEVGQFTFILKASREVPKIMRHPKKRTIGVRIPGNKTALALLNELDEPLVSSTLLLPDNQQVLTDGWTIKETLDHQIAAVLDSGDAGSQLTTVIDLSGDSPEIMRRGAGDPSAFE